MSPGGGVRTGASFSTASPAAGGASALRACTCVCGPRPAGGLPAPAGGRAVLPCLDEWPPGVDRSRFRASAMANNPAVNLPRTRVCVNPRFPSFGARAEGRNCWVLWQFRVLLCFVLFFFSPLAPVSPKLLTFLP